MTRILIADGHSIIRKGLLYHCRIQLGFQQIDEADDGNQLMEALKKTGYTHLILDLVMSDGSTLDLIGAIRKLHPDLNILIFTARPRVIYGPALEKYGIRNFVEMNAPEGEIIRKLWSFLNASVPDNQNLLGAPMDTVFGKLTRRETEVLHYWMEGLTTREIAIKLYTSDQTVSTYKNRIQGKTGTKGVKELEELARVHKYRT